MAGFLGMAAVASAEAPRDSLWIGGGGGEGRLLLRTADPSDHPPTEHAFAGTLRLSLRHLVRPRFGFEAGARYSLWTTYGFGVLSLEGGMRWERVFLGGHGAYVRGFLSGALSVPRPTMPGLGFGAGMAYVHRSPGRPTRFVELEYGLLVVPDVDAGFARQTFPSYGDHPEDRATLFPSFLGVVAGVGFGL